MLFKLVFYLRKKTIVSGKIKGEFETVINSGALSPWIIHAPLNSFKKKKKG